MKTKLFSVVFFLSVLMTGSLNASCAATKPGGGTQPTHETTAATTTAPAAPIAGSPETLEKLAANLALAVQWYNTIRPFLVSISEQSNSDADNSVLMILDLTLNPLAQTIKEINGIVNAATGSITPAEKAKYTTEASLRVQQATADLQVFLWTLIYKQIDKKQ